MKWPKILLGGLAALVLVAVGALAADRLAERAMRREVDAALAQPPFREASHGAVRYSLWRGRLEIDDLALKLDLAAAQSVRAAQVTVRGVGPSWLFGSGGDLALSAIRARQVEAADGELSATADSLALDGVRVAGGLAPEPQYSARDALAAFFARVSADHLALGAPHLRNRASGGDLGFDTVSVEHFANGRIGGLTATKGVVTGPNNGSKLRISADEIDLSGVDCVALRWIAEPQSAPGDGPVEIVEAAKLGGYASLDEGNTVSAATLSLTRLRLRPGAPLSPTSPEGLDQLLVGATLDHLDLGSLAIRRREDAIRGVTLAHLVLDKMRPGSVGDLRLEGLAIDAPNAVASVGSFEIAGLAYARKPTPIGVPRMFADRIEVKDLASGTKQGAEVTVKDLTIAMEGTLENPAGARIKAGPIAIPAKLSPPLAKLGYDVLTLAYESRMQYDAAARSLSVTQHLSAPDAGELALSLRLGHYPAAMDARDAASASLLMLQAELEHFELRYDDASLVGRFLKLYGESTGRDVDGVRRELAARFQAQRQALAGKPKLLESLDALEAFLRKPGTITLELTPPKPVALGTLMLLGQADPDQALETLGFSVR